MTDKPFTPDPDKTYSIVVPLSRPVRHGDAVYNQLTMREPTIGDQVDAVTDGLSRGAAEVAMIAVLCGVPYDVMRKVSVSDYGKLQGMAANFPYSQATPAPCAAASPASPASPGGSGPSGGE